jgi:hypothetical protein
MSARSRLKVVQAHPNVDGNCVRFLTRMQRRALRGEFQSVAIVTLDRKGEVGTGWAGDLQVFPMLGALQYLSSRLEREEID